MVFSPELLSPSNAGNTARARGWIALSSLHRVLNAGAIRRVVIGGIYFAVGQRAINSGRSTFRSLLNALERSPYFSLFSYREYISKAKQPVECRASDGYSINYSRHPLPRDLNPFPAAFFSMTHERR